MWMLKIILTNQLENRLPCKVYKLNTKKQVWVTCCLYLHREQKRIACIHNSFHYRCLKWSRKRIYIQWVQIILIAETMKIVTTKEKVNQDQFGWNLQLSKTQTYCTFLWYLYKLSKIHYNQVKLPQDSQLKSETLIELKKRNTSQ